MCSVRSTKISCPKTIPDIINLRVQIQTFYKSNPLRVGCDSCNTIGLILKNFFLAYRLIVQTLIILVGEIKQAF